jgi:hypothetical protein
MSKIIDLEMQDVRVREFFDSLPRDASGTVINANGRRLFLVVPPRAEPSVGDVDWTREKNERRFWLIDQKFAGALTESEAVELDMLQNEFGRWLDKVAPRDMETVRELHRELVDLARQSQSTPRHD